MQKKIQIQKEKETLLDLIFGCLLWGGGAQIGGIAFFSARTATAFGVGVLLGTAVAVACSVSMYRRLSRCFLTCGGVVGNARGVLLAGWLLRTALVLGVLWAGIQSESVSFPGVVIGMAGLKISAHLHAYTNQYITKKFLRRGRWRDGRQ